MSPCTPRHRLATALVITLFALGLAREMAASPLVYEGFNYVMNQPLPTMGGGTGWAPGNWTQISGGMVDQPPTLSYPSALPSSGDALLTLAPGAASRPFMAPFSNAGSDLWISFQERTSIGAVSGALVEIQQPGPSLPDIAVNKDALGAITLNGVPAGFSAGVGTVDFFVLELAQWSGGVTIVNLYVDPGAVLGPPAATIPINGPSFQAQQFFDQSNAGEKLDEIRVGTTPQDVAAVAVPEPSACSILVVGLLLAFAVLSVFTRAAQQKRRRVIAQIPICNHGAITLILCLVVGKTELASAQFDPSLQFSPTSNPDGVWTYGFETVPLGSSFNLLTLAAPIASSPGPAIDSWQSPPVGYFLGVFHNGTAAPQTVTTSGTEISLFDSGMLAMNAGPNDEYGMVQFTAPASGIYTIQGTFEGIDIAGTVSSVYLLENNFVVATGSVLGFGPSSDVPLSAGPYFLSAGDTLAYAVGGGTFDSMTALIDAQVNAVAVPEPSALALFGLAVATVAIRLRCQMPDHL